ncbi:matrix extracellular phosphoglycoprotein isoform X1 [Mus caroli]|uniref:Matrix extracellular phosphoglycoprotein isoform X1 n=1 Tax=Mus caroli TaxID=10089 RepID=A0A6P5PZG5_MUSCR|nr:matrix extracellular phosphoglycoprotein isoform X1 [Mus caroli]
MTPESLVKMQAVSVGLLLFSMTWAAPMPNEDSSGGNQGNIHRDLATSVYPETTVGEGTEDGQGALLHPPGQDRYGAALLRNITQPVKSLVTGAELRREGNQEKRPQSVLSVIPADVNDAKVSLKDIKNQERYLLSQSSLVKSKHTLQTRQTRRSTHYLTRLPQIRKTARDFEGSGSPDLLVRGDNDVPRFSGDGQHFMHIPGKGGAAVGSGPESSTSRPISGSSKAEVVDPHTNGLGSNEIPGREGHGGSAYATRDKAAQGAGSAGGSLVGGSNEITGSTNFRELSGKEGNRIDAGSQNAHQGKVEFHYPQVASREKVKGGGGEHAGRAGYNEIPKSSKGSSSKDAEESKGNQLTLTASQRFPGKGKSQGPAPPSHSLSNEVKSEENHYVFHGQNNLTMNKGMSQRRGSWPSRRPHSHRRASTYQRDSSESSSSGSSSESDGD